MVPEPQKVIVLPWEKQAMNGDEMPVGLSYPDQILYLQLRLLYDTLKKGVVDRETAKKEKKKLMEEYRQHLYRKAMGEEWVQVIKMTELARAECRKNPSQENTIRLVEIIEGRALP